MKLRIATATELYDNLGFSFSCTVRELDVRPLRFEMLNRRTEQHACWHWVKKESSDFLPSHSHLCDCPLLILTIQTQVILSPDCRLVPDPSCWCWDSTPNFSFQCLTSGMCGAMWRQKKDVWSFAQTLEGGLPMAESRRITET